MAASVGIGFQCVQCAAEGAFCVQTGRPGAERPTAARHVHRNAIGRAGRRGRRPLLRHHMVTRQWRQNNYPNIDTCILILEMLYSSASSRGRGAVTNKEGQADGKRRPDRETGRRCGHRGT